MEENLIDCPHYGEARMSSRDGGYMDNCWAEDAWTESRPGCKVLGNPYPLCDYEKNGWKDGKDGKEFMKKVSKGKLKRAVDLHEKQEKLKPENIIKDLNDRLKVLEVNDEKFQKG